MIFDHITEEKIEEKSEVIYGINRNPYEHCPAGCQVVLPTDYQLQLDIDSDAQFHTFVQNLRTFERDTNFYFAPFKVSPSKSGYPYCHVTLEAREPMTVWQRIALQFYFQSDPVREGLNCKRVMLKDPYPIALFSPIEETFK